MFVSGEISSGMPVKKKTLPMIVGHGIVSGIFVTGGMANWKVGTEELYILYISKYIGI